MEHNHNPKPLVGCAACDIEKSEKLSQEMLIDLQRDCYKELWDIIDINKVISDPKERKRILAEIGN